LTEASLRARHQPPGRCGASAPSARFAFVDAFGGLVAVPRRSDRDEAEEGAALAAESELDRMIEPDKRSP